MVAEWTRDFFFKMSNIPGSEIPTEVTSGCAAQRKASQHQASVSESVCPQYFYYSEAFSRLLRQHQLQVLGSSEKYLISPLRIYYGLSCGTKNCSFISWFLRERKSLVIIARNSEPCGQFSINSQNFQIVFKNKI